MGDKLGKYNGKIPPLPLVARDHRKSGLEQRELSPQVSLLCFGLGAQSILTTARQGGTSLVEPVEGRVTRNCGYLWIVGMCYFCLNMCMCCQQLRTFGLV